MINSFRGEYAFLSNFYEVPVTWEGLTYKNSEAAFQAAKTLADRTPFTTMTPREAKKAGRKVKLRDDWEQIKYNILYEVCYSKFTQNPELKEKLLATGNQWLEEGNTWGDRIWGTVNGVGQNMLGKILMLVREDIRKGR